jgi:hypothetical protein
LAALPTVGSSASLRSSGVRTSPSTPKRGKIPPDNQAQERRPKERQMVLWDFSIMPCSKPPHKFPFSAPQMEARPQDRFREPLPRDSHEMKPSPHLYLRLMGPMRSSDGGYGTWRSGSGDLRCRNAVLAVKGSILDCGLPDCKAPAQTIQHFNRLHGTELASM